MSDGTQFLLPYGYFEGAKFLRQNDTDVLHLRFKAHEFVVRGRALNELFTVLQSLSVEWVKACPRRYETLARNGHGFIEQIEVTDGTEGTEP